MSEPERMPRPAAAPSAPVAPPTLDELRAEAMRWGRGPRRFGAFYVAEHVVRALRAYGWPIVIGALGQPLLYLLGLVLGLAALIQAPIVDASGREVSYVVFVGPALLMTAGIQVATEEFTYPVMDGFKWRRFFFGFSASPISSTQIAIGVILGVSARIALAVVGYLLFLWLFLAAFGPQPLLPSAWGMIPVGILAGLAFGIPILAYSSSIEEDKGQFALVQRFVFVPMFLFSGTFYPLDVLPPWLVWIGWLSPLWHATELGRSLAYGMPEAPLLTVVHVVYLVALAVGGFVLARRRFVTRLAR